MGMNPRLIEKITKMSSEDLLDYIIDHPEYLTDPYYAEFKQAIMARYDELIS